MNETRKNSIALCIAFAAGTAGIVACRLGIEDPGTSATWAVVVAVIVITALAVYYIRNKIDDREQEGDNIYYLGLLFTLVSLVYTLITISVVNSQGIHVDMTRRTYDLLANFGIALCSTVWGILCRIVVQNFQREEGSESRESEGREGIGPDPYRHEEWEEATPHGTLRTAARQLRTELRKATWAFAHYNRVTRTQAEATRRVMEQMMEAFTRDIQTKTQESVKRIEDAWRFNAEAAAKAQEHIERTNRDIQSFRRDLTEGAAAMQSLEKRTRDLGTALEQESQRLTGSLKTLVEMLDGSSREIHGSATGVREANEALNTYTEQARTALEEGRQKAATALATTTEILAGHGEDVQEITAAIRTGKQALVGTVEELAKAQERLKEASEMQGTAVHRSAEALTEGAAAMQSWWEQTRDMGTTLEQEGQRLTESLKTLVAMLDGSSRDIHGSAAGVREAYQTLKTYTEYARTALEEGWQEVATAWATTARSLTGRGQEIQGITAAIRTEREALIGTAQEIAKAKEGLMEATERQWGAAQRSAEAMGNLENRIQTMGEKVQAVVDDEERSQRPERKWRPFRRRDSRGTER